MPNARSLSSERNAGRRLVQTTNASWKRSSPSPKDPWRRLRPIKFLAWNWRD